MQKDENNRLERLNKLNEFLIKWYADRNGKNNIVSIMGKVEKRFDKYQIIANSINVLQ